MALRIALSGFVVLVVAMGIGRFAFTPQVPLMIAAGQLTPHQRGPGGGDELSGLSGGSMGCNACAPLR